MKNKLKWCIAGVAVFVGVFLVSGYGEPYEYEEVSGLGRYKGVEEYYLLDYNLVVDSFYDINQGENVISFTDINGDNEDHTISLELYEMGRHGDGLECWVSEINNSGVREFEDFMGDDACERIFNEYERELDILGVPQWLLTDWRNYE